MNNDISENKLNEVTGGRYPDEDTAEKTPLYFLSCPGPKTRLFSFLKPKCGFPKSKGQFNTCAGCPANEKATK